MREIETGIDLEDTLFSSAEMFSGGGQGSNKKPVTKVRGTQYTNRQEKIRNIPRPQPKPIPRPK